MPSKWIEIKQEFFNAYGNKCKCCGEHRKEFLTVEHRNGDGAEQRKNGRSTFSTLLLLKRDNWPETSDLEINCYNCNCAKAKTKGICPHDIESGRTPVPYSVVWTYRPKLKYGEINDVIEKLLVTPKSTAELYREIISQYDNKRIYGLLSSALTRLAKREKKITKENEKWIRLPM